MTSAPQLIMGASFQRMPFPKLDSKDLQRLGKPVRNIFSAAVLLPYEIYQSPFRCSLLVPGAGA